ncbi:hypothetical protein [Paenibacillus sp. OV219]|nr:hypothetical protein [Paenibacillus sp. OV219]
MAERANTLSRVTPTPKATVGAAESAYLFSQHHLRAASVFALL